MTRHSVERVLAAARAADPRFDRAPRAERSPLPRPLSTGNLLADCERWCRDHLTPRTPAPRRTTRAVPVPAPRVVTGAPKGSARPAA